MGVQEALGLPAVDPLGDGDEVFGRHQLAHRLVALAGEADVPVGQDADQPPARFDHRNPGNPVRRHEVERVGERRVRPDGDRVDHHAGFELLDPPDLVRLLFDVEILVQDADPAGLRHGDREPALGHRVHRRGDQRNAQRDAPRQPRRGVGFARKDGGLGRHEKHVIEGKSLLDVHARAAVPKAAKIHEARANPKGRGGSGDAERCASARFRDSGSALRGRP